MSQVQQKLIMMIVATLGIVNDQTFHSRIALVPFLGANHCIFSHEKKFCYKKPQYFRIRRQKRVYV